MKSGSVRRQADMLHVLKLFRQIFGSQKRLSHVMEKASGVGGAQMWALSEVRKSPGITVGELASRLAIHRSTATNLVNRLEHLNLVAKRREGRDQRNVQLEATARGAVVCGKSPKRTIGVLQHALLEVPPTTLRTLNRDLTALTRVMKLEQGEAGLGRSTRTTSIDKPALARSAKAAVSSGKLAAVKLAQNGKPPATALARAVQLSRSNGRSSSAVSSG